MVDVLPTREATEKDLAFTRALTRPLTRPFRPSYLTPDQQVLRDLFKGGIVSSVVDDYTLTKSRVGKAIDFDGSELAANEIASRSVPLYPGKSISELFIEGDLYYRGDANITDNWTKTGTADAEKVGGSDLKHQVTLAAGDTVYHDTTLGGTGNHCLQAHVTLVSGDPSNLTLRIIKTSDSTEYISVDLSGITTTRAIAFAVGNCLATDGRFILDGNTGAVVVRIEYVGANASSVPTRPRASADENYHKEREDVRATITLGDGQALIGWWVPYHHALNAGRTGTPRWAQDNASADWNLYYGAGQFLVDVADVVSRYTVVPAANTRHILGGDWDHAGAGEVNCWYGDTVRDTDPTAAVVSVSTLRLGDWPGADRSLNGSGLWTHWTRPPTAAEMAIFYAALAGGTEHDWGSL